MNLLLQFFQAFLQILTVVNGQNVTIKYRDLQRQTEVLQLTMLMKILPDSILRGLKYVAKNIWLFLVLYIRCSNYILIIASTNDCTYHVEKYKDRFYFFFIFCLIEKPRYNRYHKHAFWTPCKLSENWRAVSLLHNVHKTPF